MSEDRISPNLTPLLDVVLQLIMFFMITVNFVSEQINQNVQLPFSSSAQEIMAQGEQDVLIVNIEVVREQSKDVSGRPLFDSKGRPIRELVEPKTIRVLFIGAEPIEFKADEEGQGLAAALRGLLLKAQSLRVKAARQLGRPLDAITKLDVPVVIRADSEVHYGLVFPLINQCNKEGFSRVELRALTEN